MSVGREMPPELSWDLVFNDDSVGLSSCRERFKGTFARPGTCADSLNISDDSDGPDDPDDGIDLGLDDEP